MNNLASQKPACFRQTIFLVGTGIFSSFFNIKKILKAKKPLGRCDFQGRV